jgi:hypothetical protein
MPFDMSDIVNDPDFAQAFTVTRSFGRFAAGGWQEVNTTTLSMWGALVPLNEKELLQLPEGDRVKGSIKVYCSSELFVTHANAPSGVSDKITWKGEEYRIASLMPFMDYGFWSVIAVRITGD